MRIGIICGSGIDNPDFFEEEAQVIDDNKYGQPSSEIKLGKINGVDVAILSRHGKHHTVPPTFINYKANIQALKDVDCDVILATTAVGSLREEIDRGDLVIPDQFIDWTKRHTGLNNVWEPFKAEHTPMAEPFDKKLRKVLAESCKELELKHHKNKCLITIEGPRFSTIAESNMFRSFGADIINMTVATECIMANQIKIPYAVIAMSTDYDCWRTDEKPVSWEEILKIFEKNAANVIEVLKLTIKKLGE